MNCKKTQRKLEAYQGGELSREAHARVEHHLASCAECSRELEHAEHLRVTLARRVTPPVPDGFRHRLMERARRESEKEVGIGKILHPFRGSPVLSSRMRMAVAAGMIVATGIGVLVGVGLWNGGESSRRPTDQAAEAGDYGLDYLAGTPEGSVANAYVRLTSTDQGE